MRIGFFTLPHTGHLYPAAALGRRLSRRGHEIIFFNFVMTKAIIRTAELSFALIPTPSGQWAVPPEELNSKAQTSLYGLQAVTKLLLTEAPEVIKSANLDALIIDQMDLATPTVAEMLGLPFVHFSTSSPIFQCSSVPPVWFPWRYFQSPAARRRNIAGYRFVWKFLAPVISMVNQKRQSWGLRPFLSINDTISPRALITQMPEFLDFTSTSKPKQVFYTGPFFDGHGRRAVKFPWERLTDKPLIYASMGTRQNDELHIFHTIAEACKDIDAQLVISTGGNLGELGSLAGNPIVVPYAPQPELLSKASLVISHAGANTLLESLSCGVPMAAVPIADDQPGIAARIEHAGLGTVVPFEKVSVEKLRGAIDETLGNPAYRAAAQKMQAMLQKKDWLESAADITESALKVKI